MHVELVITGGPWKEPLCIPNIFIGQNEQKLILYPQKLSHLNSYCFKIKMRPLGCDNVLLMDLTSLSVCAPQGFIEDEDFEKMDKRFKNKYQETMRSLAKLEAAGGHEDDLCVESSSRRSIPSEF